MFAFPRGFAFVVAVVGLVLELLEELAALFEGGVLFLVHVDQFLLVDEELCAGGDALRSGGVGEGFGEGGEAFRVVGYEGWGGALGLEVGG